MTRPVEGNRLVPGPHNSILQTGWRIEDRRYRIKRIQGYKMKRIQDTGLQDQKDTGSKETLRSLVAPKGAGGYIYIYIYRERERERETLIWSHAVVATFFW